MEYNANEIVNHINTLGICVLEDYFTQEECSQAKKELDYCFNEYKDNVQVLIHEGCGGDERLFSVERQSTIAKKFAEDELLSQVCSKYLGEAGRCHQVLAGRLTADKEKVINSGGGWHRDSNTKQFKALAYLTDDGIANLCESNGIKPFVVTAKAGTVILTATNNIHRGANIEEGQRYSFTNYYYPANMPTKKTWEKWSVPVK